MPQALTRLPHLPQSFDEFQEHTQDNSQCILLLAAYRWPHGYQCAGCGSKHSAPNPGRRTFTCLTCKQQASVTADTFLHGSRLPIQVWLRGIYLFATRDEMSNPKHLMKSLHLSRPRAAAGMTKRFRKALDSINGPSEILLREEARKNPDAAFGLLLSALLSKPAQPRK